jgi:hypothetical protein
VAWHDLPEPVRDSIVAKTGTYLSDESVGTGHNCLLGSVLRTTSGSVFLKGVPADHARAVWTQRNEAVVNRHVQPLAPRLLFHIQSDNWDILGFEYLHDSRHADLSPGSPDLPHVAATLQSLAELPSPPTTELRTIDDRWRDYAGAAASLLAGRTLAHTDLHRHNILISGTAKLVDWAWPTLAANWIDTASLAVQLIQAGHTPAEAETWCRSLPAYAAANEEAISTFVAAAAGLWREISDADPQPWKAQVATAAHRWAQYRGLQATPDSR